MANDKRKDLLGLDFSQPMPWTPGAPPMPAYQPPPQAPAPPPSAPVPSNPQALSFSQPLPWQGAPQPVPMAPSGPAAPALRLPPGAPMPKSPMDWAKVNKSAQELDALALTKNGVPPKMKDTNVDLSGMKDAKPKAGAQGSDAAKDMANLEGATFYDGPGSVGSQMGGAPVLISKGGRTPHSWASQTVEGMHFSPEVDKAAEKSFNSQREAIEAERTAGINKAVSEAAYHDTVAKLGEQSANEEKIRRDRQNREIAAANAKIDALVEKGRTGELNANRWWENADAATLASVSIGAILGGIGQGLIGGRNAGIDKLNNAIEMDLKTQQANLSNNRAKLEDARGGLASLVHQFGDENAGAQAYRILQLEAAKNRMMKTAAETNTDSVIANAKKNAAALDLEIAKHRERFETITQDRTQRTQNDVNAPAQYAGGYGGPVNKSDKEDIHKISAGLEGAGVPATMASLHAIDRSINAFAEKHGDREIPGIGPIESHVPDTVAKHVWGNQSVAARQAYQAIRLDLGHAIAGASMSENEKAELNKLLTAAGDAESLNRVVQMTREKVSLRARNVMAQGSDTARAEYTRRFAATGQEKNPMVAPLDRPTTPYQRPVK